MGEEVMTTPCEITCEEVEEALTQLRTGNSMAVIALLRRMPMHYLAEALTLEVEDCDRTFDCSFLTGLDSVLWRTVRFQHANRSMT